MRMYEYLLSESYRVSEHHKYTAMVCCGNFIRVNKVSLETILHHSKCENFNDGLAFVLNDNPVSTSAIIHFWFDECYLFWPSHLENDK